MSEPFIGEIKMIGFGFAPRNWAYCDGQLIDITQNPSLYALIGTTYGGDGMQNFALPDLRGRTPVHRGSQYYLGARWGYERVLLTENEMPPHTHAVKASTAAADTGSPTDAFWTSQAGGTPYSNGTPDTTMHGGIISAAGGGGQAHENMQPFTVVGFCIALQGMWPVRP